MTNQIEKLMSRVVVWFSCGEASAVAAHLACGKYPEIDVVYCNTLSTEHPDNLRFLNEVSAWIGVPITIIGSTKYESVDDVFERERYMSGIKGARCTVEMKKVPRNDFQRADDLHIFGFTVDEPKRFHDFKRNNPELRLEWILGDSFIRKSDCARILSQAGIARPAMYELGFEHNNCIGCVKATSPSYWQRVARVFPDVFKRRCVQSRDIGARLVRVDGVRIFLDELDLTRNFDQRDGDIECGPYCISPQFEFDSKKQALRGNPAEAPTSPSPEVISPDASDASGPTSANAAPAPKPANSPASADSRSPAPCSKPGPGSYGPGYPSSD